MKAKSSRFFLRNVDTASRMEAHDNAVPFAFSLSFGRRCVCAGRESCLRACVAAVSASAKVLMADEDRLRLEAAIRTIQDVQGNL